jgi:Arc/MetJ family transcription regulator
MSRILRPAYAWIEELVIWTIDTFKYGCFLWHDFSMKKTMHIDARLLTNAKLACGAGTDTETVRLGLEALVRHGAHERLRALRGSEPGARDVPRRREQPSRPSKRKVA